MMNCVCYVRGYCTHQAAPRRLFGPAYCIKLEKLFTDPRIMKGCALQVPRPDPVIPPGNE